MLQVETLAHIRVIRVVLAPPNEVEVVAALERQDRVRMNRHQSTSGGRTKDEWPRPLDRVPEERVRRRHLPVPLDCGGEGGARQSHDP